MCDRYAEETLTRFRPLILKRLKKRISADKIGLTLQRYFKNSSPSGLESLALAGDRDLRTDAIFRLAAKRLHRKLYGPIPTPKN